MELTLPTVRRALLTTASPVLPAIGRVQWVTDRLLTTADVDDFLATNPLPGTILLARKRGQLTNLLIPGEWKHLAVYCGERVGVVEAVWPRVRRIPIGQWMPGEDYVEALVPTDWCTPQEMALAAGFAATLEGLPYDTVFEYARPRAVNKAFYCAEVGWWSYEQPFLAAGKNSPFTPRRTMGVATVTPDDFKAAVDKWKSTWSRARPR